MKSSALLLLALISLVNAEAPLAKADILDKAKKLNLSAPSVKELMAKLDNLRKERDTMNSKSTEVISKIKKQREATDKEIAGLIDEIRLLKEKTAVEGLTSYTSPEEDCDEEDDKKPLGTPVPTPTPTPDMSRAAGRSSTTPTPTPMPDMSVAARRSSASAPTRTTQTPISTPVPSDDAAGIYNEENITSGSFVQSPGSSMMSIFAMAAVLLM